MKTARDIVDLVIDRIEGRGEDPVPDYPFTPYPAVATVVFETLRVLADLDYLELEEEETGE